MTDLRTLTDAFAELERRADAASAGMPLQLPSRRVRRPASRLVPVAATAAAVAGLTAAAVLLAPGDNPGTQPGSPPPAGGSAAEGPTSTAPPASAIPDTPEELAARFRAVLGDTATFTVTWAGPGATVMTAPPSGRPAAPDGHGGPSTTVGATIMGTLTASGVTGGFDLKTYPTASGEGRLRCSGDRDVPRCTARQLADGSTLLVGQMSLEGSPTGTGHWVHLSRPGGFELDLHVSNQRSPKGNSEVLGPKPPLTIDQMVAIVTSDRW